MSACGPSRPFAATQQFCRFQSEADIQRAANNRTGFMSTRPNKRQEDTRPSRSGKGRDRTKRYIVTQRKWWGKRQQQNCSDRVMRRKLRNFSDISKMAPLELSIACAGERSPANLHWIRISIDILLGCSLGNEGRARSLGLARTAERCSEMCWRRRGEQVLAQPTRDVPFQQKSNTKKT